MDAAAKLSEPITVLVEFVGIRGNRIQREIRIVGRASDTDRQLFDTGLAHVAHEIRAMLRAIEPPTAGHGDAGTNLIRATGIQAP